VLFMVLRGVYTAFESAILEVNETKIKSLADTDRKYRKLLKLVSSPKRLRVSLSVWRAFCIIAMVLCFVESNAFDVWVYSGISKLLESISVAYEGVVSLLAMLLYAFVLVVLVIAFTDVLPKHVAEKYIDGLAIYSVFWVRAIEVILKPLTLLIDGISYVVCKLLGLRSSNDNDIVTEEEILKMVETGNETGVIEESQKDMINNIFDFEDVTICDVMTHRKDIIAIDINSKISELVYIANNEGVSRIPVYESNVDNIVGIIYVKDLLSLVGCKDSEKFDVSQFVRKVMYVHEYCKCSELFKSMTKKKLQMAIVVDEYGGTAGLITLEDLIEEIVGNIQDEYDQEEREIDEISEGVFTIDGSTDIDDVCSVLGITLPQEHNYDTMSAFIVDLLGHIPDEDELAVVKYQGVTFTVLLVEDNWVSKIKATKQQQEQQVE
jgi:putative hemolysin